MHAINLGLLYDVNGSCLQLGLSVEDITHVCIESTDACFFVFPSVYHTSFALLGWLRMALCAASYFGAAADLQGHFDLAYGSFKRFCKANRIPTSQPPFKVRNVPEPNCCGTCVPCHAQHTHGSEKHAYTSPAKVVKKNGQIMFTAKAFNGRVIVEWLAHCTSDLVQQQGAGADGRLALLASCAHLGPNSFHAPVLIEPFDLLDVWHVERKHVDRSVFDEWFLSLMAVVCRLGWN